MEKKIVLYDTVKAHDNLLPLTFTRPVALLRVGIDTVAEKWAALTGCEAVPLPVDYLVPKFGGHFDHADALFISGDVLPTPALAQRVASLPECTRLTDPDGETVAMRCPLHLKDSDTLDTVALAEMPDRLRYVFDIFLLNGRYIEADFRRITKGRTSQPLSDTNTVVGSYLLPDGTPSIFIEPGATVEGAIINVTKGPVYVGTDAEIMEGACVRGPLALCRHARINMGAKVYSDTTIGPWCKAGGELNNVVMTGYSNKSHDGYLGNAVIGEWCNIGAGVNASNLKNDYSKIRLWNYATGSFMRTDLQFCGLIMGDHSKIGISVMLNTATVIGVGVNLHGAGFPRTFIPSFSQGSPTGGFKDVSVKTFADIAERVMSRRDVALTDADRAMFENVREVASRYKR